MIKLIRIFSLLFICTSLFAQQATPTENDYYKIVKVPMPEGIVLEVGGLCPLPNGDLAVATRRGDVWIVENPAMAGGSLPNFKKFASGLHEILGLAYKNGNLYCSQRGELTKLVDKNNDGRADVYETVYSWPISGHYHEYSFGPKIAPDGSFFVTANVGFGNSDWWAGKSLVPWRGWTMHITEDGKMEPYAAGMRSPCGIGMYDGQFVYGDNQGDWMGSGFVSFVEKGDFMGHPASLRWADRAESPVKVRKEMIFAKIDPRDNPVVKPEYIQNEAANTIYEVAKANPNMGIKSPAVWLPHGVLGISTSEILTDETKGNFGPFNGQVFVGDQGMSKIARVFFEKVNGRYQGASFDFRSGFVSGVLRMAWVNQKELFVGGTNRGWGSTGKEPYGLERLVWTGVTPFEMKTVKAMPDGFEIEFTQPADAKTLANLANYSVSSYIYKYHPVYGSPMINTQENAVRAAVVSADRLKVRLVIDGLREGYIHQIDIDGVLSKENNPLLHDKAYYTLNSIPTGEKLSVALAPIKAKTKKTNDAGKNLTSPDGQMKEAAPTAAYTTSNDKKGAKKSTAALPVNEKEVMKLLSKYTCLACHKANEKVVGPSYAEVAKRQYTNEQIEELIKQPKPQNWPSYATEMAPFPNIPKGDLQKIAAWINGLGRK